MRASKQARQRTSGGIRKQEEERGSKAEREQVSVLWEQDGTGSSFAFSPADGELFFKCCLKVCEDTS